MRKRLSDILHGSDRDRIQSAWDSTEAAEEFKPLPAGEYDADIERGEPFTSKSKGTPGYKLAFKVLDGDCAGRRFWHEIWLTEAALAMAKRDLLKLGVESLDQLDLPLPLGIRCRVRLVLRTDDDGNEFNRVKWFDVTGIEPPEDDPYAPAPVPTVTPPTDDEAAAQAEPAGGAA
ncbi:MAG: DUF669 domain-containing protein [Pirellulales bacterium]